MIRPGFKIKLYVAVMLTITIGFALFSPLYIFLIGLNYLCIEHTILFGGFLSWLNKKEEERFEETAILRNMMAFGGRLVIGLCIAFTFYALLACNTEFPMNHVVEYSPGFIRHALLRLMALSLIILSIHHMLINERLIGVAFVYYPPLCKAIHRILKNVKV